MLQFNLHWITWLFEIDLNNLRVDEIQLMFAAGYRNEDHSFITFLRHCIVGWTNFELSFHFNRNTLGGSENEGFYRPVVVFKRVEILLCQDKFLSEAIYKSIQVYFENV